MWGTLRNIKLSGIMSRACRLFGRGEKYIQNFRRKA